MIAAGKYLARPLQAQLGYTGTGKEQVAVLFQVRDGQPHAGEKITWYGYFTEATTDRTLESLEYCGWDGEGLTDESLNSIGNVDTDVELVIDDEPDLEGKMRARVRWVNKPGGRGIAVKQALSTAEAQAFDQRMKGAILARKQKRAQQPQQSDSSFDYGANKGGGPPV